jgi:NADH:ubiquinone oxidoreductase subunit K
MKKARGWLFGGTLLVLCAALNAVGAFRYVTRIPEDTIGIVLFTVTSVCFAIAGLGFLITWRKENTQP